MVQTQHRNFTLFYQKWLKMRHIFEGDECLKHNAQLYIPMLEGQTEKQYNDVINREAFENYTKSTGKGIGGLIFAKNPQIELPKAIEAIQDNIDLSGNNLIDLAQTVVNEVNQVGRVGLLVDTTAVQEEITSRLQETLLNVRPYIKVYKTETIVNWDVQMINNQSELSLLVLCEVYNHRLSMFQHEERIRYRVFSMENGICVARIFESNNTDKKNYFQVGEDLIPKIQNKPLSFIPFVSITAEKLGIEPVNPPLLDIANINLSHWYLSVERRNALHFVGFPSIYGVNLQIPKGSTVNLGAGTINTFDSPQAELRYLQLSAEGLASIEKALEEKKQAMLALGARLLAPESATQISENTMQMKTAGQRATIIQVADTVSRGIEKALQFLGLWLNDTSPVVFKLNTDYNLAEMSPQLLQQINTTYQIGNMTKKDLYNNLKKGELTEYETFDEWVGDLETQSPLAK